MSDLNFCLLSNSSASVDSSIASQTESQFIEVSGLMDDFTSIEEFAPGSNWEEVLAASWGVPCVSQPEKSPVFASLRALGVRSMRSILQSVRAKKFEVA